MNQIQIQTNPECSQGKHNNCHGDAWDTNLDQPALCECPCHFNTTGGAA